MLPPAHAPVHVSTCANKNGAGYASAKWKKNGAPLVSGSRSFSSQAERLRARSSQDGPREPLKNKRRCLEKQERGDVQGLLIWSSQREWVVSPRDFWAFRISAASLFPLPIQVVPKPVLRVTQTVGGAPEWTGECTFHHFPAETVVSIGATHL